MMRFCPKILVAVTSNVVGRAKPPWNVIPTGDDAGVDLISRGIGWYERAIAPDILVSHLVSQGFA